eukprot:6368443-Amphidinium_carterae.1
MVMLVFACMHAKVTSVTLEQFVSALASCLSYLVRCGHPWKMCVYHQQAQVMLRLQSRGGLRKEMYRHAIDLDMEQSCSLSLGRKLKFPEPAQ